MKTTYEQWLAADYAPIAGGAYMRNKDTAAVIGPLTDDSAEYLFLQAVRDSSGRPVWEDVGTQEVGTVAAKGQETRQGLVDATATAATALVTIARAPFAGNVNAVTYMPSAVITGANTNSRTVNAINGGQAGAGSTNVASLAFVAGVNATANQPLVVPLNATPANLVVAQNDEIQWQSLAVGTGIADPGGLVVITFSRE